MSTWADIKFLSGNKSDTIAVLTQLVKSYQRSRKTCLATQGGVVLAISPFLLRSSPHHCILPGKFQGAIFPSSRPYILWPQNRLLWEERIGFRLHISRCSFPFAGQMWVFFLSIWRKARGNRILPLAHTLLTPPWGCSEKGRNPCSMIGIIFLDNRIWTTPSSNSNILGRQLKNL